MSRSTIDRLSVDVWRTVVDEWVDPITAAALACVDRGHRAYLGGRWCALGPNRPLPRRWSDTPQPARHLCWEERTPPECLTAVGAHLWSAHVTLDAPATPTNPRVMALIARSAALRRLTLYLGSDDPWLEYWNRTAGALDRLERLSIGVDRPMLGTNAAMKPIAAFERLRELCLSFIGAVGESDGNPRWATLWGCTAGTLPRLERLTLRTNELDLSLDGPLPPIASDRLRALTVDVTTSDAGVPYAFVEGLADMLRTTANRPARVEFGLMVDDDDGVPVLTHTAPFGALWDALGRVEDLELRFALNATTDADLADFVAVAGAPAWRRVSLYLYSEGLTNACADALWRWCSGATACADVTLEVQNQACDAGFWDVWTAWGTRPALPEAVRVLRTQEYSRDAPIVAAPLLHLPRLARVEVCQLDPTKEQPWYGEYRDTVVPCCARSVVVDRGASVGAPLDTPEASITALELTVQDWTRAGPGLGPLGRCVRLRSLTLNDYGARWRNNGETVSRLVDALAGMPELATVRLTLYHHADLDVWWTGLARCAALECLDLSVMSFATRSGWTPAPGAPEWPRLRECHLRLPEDANPAPLCRAAPRHWPALRDLLLHPLPAHAVEDLCRLPPLDRCDVQPRDAAALTALARHVPRRGGPLGRLTVRQPHSFHTAVATADASAVRDGADLLRAPVVGAPPGPSMVVLVGFDATAVRTALGPDARTVPHRIQLLPYSLTTAVS